MVDHVEGICKRGCKGPNVPCCKECAITLCPSCKEPLDWPSGEGCANMTKHIK